MNHNNMSCSLTIPAFGEVIVLDGPGRMSPEREQSQPGQERSCPHISVGRVEEA